MAPEPTHARWQRRASSSKPLRRGLREPRVSPSCSRLRHGRDFFGAGAATAATAGPTTRVVRYRPRDRRRRRCCAAALLLARFLPTKSKVSDESTPPTSSSTLPVTATAGHDAASKPPRRSVMATRRERPIPRINPSGEKEGPGDRSVRQAALPRDVQAQARGPGRDRCRLRGVGG